LRKVKLDTMREGNREKRRTGSGSFLRAISDEMAGFVADLADIVGGRTRRWTVCEGSSQIESKVQEDE
jgi:hypothetical protein